MKIMISQPMKCKTNEQIRKERVEIVTQLTNEGHEVIDTVFAENPKEVQNKSLFYLAKSIEAMSRVDGVVFMHGWENARGCVIEHEISIRYGLFVREL